MTTEISGLELLRNRILAARGRLCDPGDEGKPSAITLDAMAAGLNAPEHAIDLIRDIWHDTEHCGRALAYRNLILACQFAEESAATAGIHSLEAELARDLFVMLIRARRLYDTRKGTSV